jgi:hypothetical protein
MHPGEGVYITADQESAFDVRLSAPATIMAVSRGLSYRSLPLSTIKVALVSWTYDYQYRIREIIFSI